MEGLEREIRESFHSLSALPSNHSLSELNSTLHSIVLVLLKFSAEFKKVVYEIERYIKYAQVDHKIRGIYVIDFLLNYLVTHKKKNSREIDNYFKRFSMRMNDIMSLLVKINSNDQKNLINCIQNWYKKSFFSSSVLKSLKLGDVLLASQLNLSSIDNQKNVMNSNQMNSIKKVSKVCPFKEFGCPYNEKCRFSHYDNNTIDDFIYTFNNNSYNIKEFVPLDLTVQSSFFSSLFDDKKLTELEEDDEDIQQNKKQKLSTFYRDQSASESITLPELPLNNIYRISYDSASQLFLYQENKTIDN